MNMDGSMPRDGGKTFQERTLSPSSLSCSFWEYKNEGQTLELVLGELAIGEYGHEEGNEWPDFFKHSSLLTLLPSSKSGPQR
jgi:hypothetical protein